jgi:predicted MFS family arabinose efflux permease
MEIATIVISTCFIIDNLLFAVGTARSSYIARIVERKEDITPSLYSGMAINHVTSIAGAALGGLIWTVTGTPTWTFVFAASLAIFSGITASKIRD